MKKGTVLTGQNEGRAGAGIHLLASQRMMAHSGAFGGVTLVDVDGLRETGCLRSREVEGPSEMSGIGWLNPADPQVVITGSRTGNFLTFDTRTRLDHRLLNISLPEPATVAAFSVDPRDPNSLAALATTGVLHRWDLRSPPTTHSRYTLQGLDLSQHTPGGIQLRVRLLSLPLCFGAPAKSLVFLVVRAPSTLFRLRVWWSSSLLFS